jgi:hypothetical protein
VALSQINHTNANLRRWSIFCLGKLWESHREAKELAVSVLVVVVVVVVMCFVF